MPASKSMGNIVEIVEEADEALLQNAQENRLHKSTNSVVKEAKMTLSPPIISPIVRTKSSFAFRYCNLQQLAGNTMSSSQALYSSKDNIDQQPHKQSLLSIDSQEEDGFLKNIDLKGFPGVWNHYVTRTYFFMYLMLNRYESLFLLRMDTILFRNNFESMSMQSRITNCKKIYNSYFKVGAVLQIAWPEEMQSTLVLPAVDLIRELLETPDITMFDEISFLALQAMQLLYAGAYSVESGGSAHVSAQHVQRSIERGLETMQLMSLEHIVDKVGLHFDLIQHELGITSPFSPIQSARRQQSMYLVRDKSLGVSSRELALVRQEAHTYLPNKNVEMQWCQYCLKSFSIDKPSEDFLSPYKCEVCNYMCHKMCRGLTRLSCLKLSNNNDLDSIEIGSERVKLVAEKLAVLQKEIDMEMKIQDGLEKIAKAKGSLRLKKKVDPDISNQLEMSGRRLETLKHEMQKRRIQLQSLQAKNELISQLNNSLSASEDTNQPSDNDGGILRVLVEDPQTKIQAKKVIYISNNQSTLEVITTILGKANVSGKPNEFQLSYQLSDHQIVMKPEDRPMQQENKTEVKSDIKRIDTLFQKQQEILGEIYESEEKYCNDLHLLDAVFAKPFEQSIRQEDVQVLFANLQEIISIHDLVQEKINQRPGKSVETLTNIPKLDVYLTYCGNQFKAQRLLGQLMTDINFSKMRERCESNPKLQKLTLADMLAKPMQRITRYPLLLKRLKPNLVTDSQEHKNLSKVISEIENLLQTINATIKTKEASYRIKLIDESLEFGLKFKIANDDRELVSEKQLSMVKKPGNVTVEVILMLFSDMILIAKTKKSGGFSLLKPPIPLEDVLFMDKPDTPNAKHCFQIVHLQVESYTFQTFSQFDKNSWLQEAESVRAGFTILQYQIETSFVRLYGMRSKSMIPAIHQQEQSDDSKQDHPRNLSEPKHDETRLSIMMLFRSKKSVEQIDSSNQEASRKLSKRMVEKTDSEELHPVLVGNELKSGFSARLSNSLSHITGGSIRQTKIGEATSNTSSKSIERETSSPLRSQTYIGEDIDSLIAAGELQEPRFVAVKMPKKEARVDKILEIAQKYWRDEDRYTYYDEKLENITHHEFREDIDKSTNIKTKPRQKTPDYDKLSVPTISFKSKMNIEFKGEANRGYKKRMRQKQKENEIVVSLRELMSQKPTSSQGKQISFSDHALEFVRLLEKEEYLRPMDDKIKCAKVLKASSNFCNVSEFLLVQVLGVAGIVSLKEGEILFEQGTWCKRWFFLLSGSVGIYTRKEGQQYESKYGIEIGRINEGSGFGEQAVVTDSMRSKTALCKKDSILMYLNKDDYIRFFWFLQESERKQKMLHLKKLPMCARMSSSEIRAAANTFKPESIVIEQGKETKYLGFLCQGDCIATMDIDYKGKQKQVILDHLKPGDYFGEQVVRIPLSRLGKEQVPNLYTIKALSQCTFGFILNEDCKLRIQCDIVPHRLSELAQDRERLGELLSAQMEDKKWQSKKKSTLQEWRREALKERKQYSQQIQKPMRF
ncbi:hypothetical protein EDD86DRAFT_249172 [Gorgonomyces haynaldii]|nr:hypothetical protein EDD86DRAFT_249172 [Gorgonomyces haynaldii]